MKLYAIPQCPFAQRVFIGLKVRQIDTSILPIEMIDLSKPPAAMLAINSHGSVPTLEMGPNDGFNESLVINEFLDTLEAKGPKLYGNTPAQTAKTKVLLENISSKFSSALNQILHLKGNELQFRKCLETVPAAYRHFEDFLKKTEGPFFGGPTLNAVDATLAPFIVRLMLACEVRNNIPLPPAGTRAAAYFTALVNHPIVKETTAPDLMESIKWYLLAEAGVVAVQNASRHLVDGLEQRVAQLNSAFVASHPRTKADTQPVWQLGSAARGAFLHARFKFADVNDAVAAVQVVAQIQESADHHTSFKFHDFATLDLTLCTHEPKWGVSEKDFAMASLLSEKLLQA